MITIITGTRIVQGTVREYMGTSHDQYPTKRDLNVHNTIEDL
jgi:hypothetical protein